MKIAKRSEKGESKNRPVATNFQFLKILAPLGQLLVGACLPQTLLERVRQTGIYSPLKTNLLFLLEIR
ncbi:MAG: hypothetical protein ACLUAX_14030, partial [Faecalibacterium prausnitzii]